ncbi:hypothetical protein AGMMS49982_13650 [Bacteroidia bacterium]|nr:hypothetical protein AGMMS49982_13650 [Bacteroidia bacterium]
MHDKFPFFTQTYSLKYPVWGTILITPYKRSAVRGGATTPTYSTPEGHSRQVKGDALR